MKKILSILMVLVLVFGLTSCTTYNNFRNAFFGTDASDDAPQTIKIGVYEPVSGTFSRQASEEIKGIELAHDVCPRVLNKDIELIYADNKSSMYEAETALDELFKYNPNFILGSYGETLSMVAGDYLKNTKTPGITITATNPLLTVNNDYYFTATYAESRQGYALANFAYNDQEKPFAAAVRKEGDDIALAMVKRFNTRIRNLSDSMLNITGSYTISSDSGDYSGVIENLKNSKAESVFLALNAEDSISFIQQCIDAEYTDVLFLGSNSWNDANVQKIINDNGLDAGYVADIAYNTDPGAYNTFLTAFKEKYGEDQEPTLACATAFDAYMLAIKAMEDAMENVKNLDLDELVKGMSEAQAQATKQSYNNMIDSRTPDGNAIREALLAINDYEGASGKVKYNGSNEARKTVTVQHVKQGVELNAFVL